MKKDKTNIEQLNTEEAAREVAVEKDHDPGDAVTAQDGEKTPKKPILKKVLIVVAVLVCAAVIAGLDLSVPVQQHGFLDNGRRQCLCQRYRYRRDGDG